MKKKLALIVVFVLLISSLMAACSSNSSGSSADTPADTSADTSGSTADTPAAVTTDDTVYQFTLQNADAAGGTTSQFLDAWCAAVKEASGGRIDITCYHGGTLGGMPDSYDMVKDGTVDFAWGLPSFSPGVFPSTEVISLPLIGADDSLQASYALWELYSTNSDMQKEWSNVKVILLHTNCPAPMMSNSKITSVSDLAGKTIRASSGPPTDFLNILGASPISTPISEVYTSMEKNVYDITTSCGWDVISSFKFYEQCDYILDIGFHVNPYFFVMNLDSYNSLPADLQAIIDDYTGEAALEIVGSRWQDIQKATMDTITDGNLCEIYSLSDDVFADFASAADEVQATWIAEKDADGIDGQALVDSTKQLLDKYANLAE